MKTQYREWIGKRMIHFRTLLKKTQEEMATLLRVTEGMYRHYEAGRAEPGICTLYRFCKQCDITTDYFLDGSPAECTEQP